MKPLRVLNIEDFLPDHELLRRHLEKAGFDLTLKRVETAADMERELRGGQWDVILCDYSMPGFSAPAALELLKGVDPDIPFIVVSGTVGEEEAVKALKAGASDYLIKNNLARLVPAIEREIVDAENRRTKKLLEQQLAQAQRLHSVGRLAGGIAHDFNNMLTAINGFCELALRQLSEDHPVRNNLVEIKKAGERSALLTSQLLAFSRQQLLRPEVFDLNDVIAETSQMLERIIGNDVELVTSLRPGTGRVKVDRGQLSQILMNLVVNGRDAMPDGGTLSIETGNEFIEPGHASTNTGLLPGAYVKLVVSDTGSGIADEFLPHIFEPFFTTKEVGKGTGLGLATVYGIVRQSGGGITVHSERGAGTAFNIYLPRSVEEASQTAVANEPDSLASGKETILLVEDEEVVRALVRSLLETCGYRVIEAADGIAALAMLQEMGPNIDLLITDLVMPRMSGRELAERVHEIHPQVPILFTSGYTDNRTFPGAVSQNGSSILQKPFTLEVIAGKVREMLDRNR